MSYEARNDNYIRDVSQEVNEAVAFCSMQCHCGGGTKYNVTLRCFDGFRKNEDGNIEYKPTAEWQRIQTELQQGREAVEKLKRFELKVYEYAQIEGGDEYADCVIRQLEKEVDDAKE